MKRLDKVPVPPVGPRRTKTEREADRAEAARLDRKGYTVTEIARIIGVSKQQISYDLKRLRRQYLKAALVERAAKVQEKLEELRDIRREAWEAWEQSKGALTDEMAEEIMQKLLQMADNSGSLRIAFARGKLQGLRIEVAYKPQYECLRILLSCVEAERELLGLDSAKTTAVAQANLDWNALLRDVQNHKPKRIESLIVDALDGQCGDDTLAYAEVESENGGSVASTAASR
jgi:DNA-binding transcriptional ArsR family regulator